MQKRCSILRLGGRCIHRLLANTLEAFEVLETFLLATVAIKFTPQSSSEGPVLLRPLRSSTVRRAASKHSSGVTAEGQPDPPDGQECPLAAPASPQQPREGPSYPAPGLQPALLNQDFLMDLRVPLHPAHSISSRGRAVPRSWWVSPVGCRVRMAAALPGHCPLHRQALPTQVTHLNSVFHSQHHAENHTLTLFFNC